MGTHPVGPLRPATQTHPSSRYTPKCLGHQYRCWSDSQIQLTPPMKFKTANTFIASPRCLAWKRSATVPPTIELPTDEDIPCYIRQRGSRCQ